MVSHASFLQRRLHSMALEGGCGGRGGLAASPPRSPKARGGGWGGKPSEAQAEAASAQHLHLHASSCTPLSLVNPVHGKNWILFGFSNEF